MTNNFKDKFVTNVHWILTAHGQQRYNVRAIIEFFWKTALDLYRLVVMLEIIMYILFRGYTGGYIAYQFIGVKHLFTSVSTMIWIIEKSFIPLFSYFVMRYNQFLVMFVSQFSMVYFSFDLFLIRALAVSVFFRLAYE